MPDIHNTRKLSITISIGQPQQVEQKKIKIKNQHCELFGTTFKYLIKLCHSTHTF